MIRGRRQAHHDLGSPPWDRDLLSAATVLLCFGLPALGGLGCMASAAPQPALAFDLALANELATFEFTDAAAWRLGSDGGRGCLELFRQSSYEPPHRSPHNLALLRDAAFADFELTVHARQTGPEYPHRDLVIVFAYLDAAHFAYAHFASQADENAHQIMLVDGADRRPVTTARTGGVAWGAGWHELRVVRRGSGVEAFFDGDNEPVLRGEVPPWRGRVGFGSFDDTGNFAGLRVRALRRR